jgi:hypothetical protein
LRKELKAQALYIKQLKEDKERITMLARKVVVAREWWDLPTFIDALELELKG